MPYRIRYVNIKFVPVYSLAQTGGFCKNCIDIY